MWTGSLATLRPRSPLVPASSRPDTHGHEGGTEADRSTVSPSLRCVRSIGASATCVIHSTSPPAFTPSCWPSGHATPPPRRWYVRWRKQRCSVSSLQRSTDATDRDCTKMTVLRCDVLPYPHPPSRRGVPPLGTAPSCDVDEQGEPPSATAPSVFGVNRCGMNPIPAHLEHPRTAVSCSPFTATTAATGKSAPRWCKTCRRWE